MITSLLQFDGTVWVGDITPMLLCPNCGDSYLHHDKVEVFECGEDAAYGVHVTVENGHSSFDTKMEGNPSARRHGLNIHFWCECCYARPILSIAQHKGQTECYFTHDPECGPNRNLFTAGSDDIKGIWDNALSYLNPPSCQMLLRQQGYLLSIENSVARIGVVSFWVQTVNNKIDRIENAFETALERQIKVKFVPLSQEEVKCLILAAQKNKTSEDIAAVLPFTRGATDDTH